MDIQEKLRAAEKDYFEGKTGDKSKKAGPLVESFQEAQDALGRQRYDADEYRAHRNEEFAREYRNRLFDLDRDYHRRIVEATDEYCDEVEKLRKLAKAQNLIDDSGRYPWQDGYNQTS